MRLLRLAACATDGFARAVLEAVAMHPPVCHCKYRRRLIVHRPLDIVMPCDSSRPTMSSDDLMLSMIRRSGFCVAYCRSAYDVLILL